RGEVMEEGMKYWRKQLEGAERLEMPGERKASVGGEMKRRGGRERIRIGVEESERIREMSRRMGATMYMSMLAGLKVLLSRYSGQEDIVVGSPIAGRSRKEV